MQEKYLALLQQTTLFRGVDGDKLPLMLNCLSAYSKNMQRMNTYCIGENKPPPSVLSFPAAFFSSAMIMPATGRF